jgi:DNA-binding response OmpR family regulator
MRVLVIEANASTAQSIELMLKSQSFNVYTTDLGEEGIEYYKNESNSHLINRRYILAISARDCATNSGRRPLISKQFQLVYKSHLVVN